MQTAKIKPGEIYAYKRSGDLVRFQVDEIVTRKGSDGPATNEIVGSILEDQRPGFARDQITMKPDDLLGPYAEQAELRERAEQERRAREDEKKAADQQAKADRLMLYKFVGVEPPKNAAEYRQMFRVNYGGVDITSDGQKALLERIREITGKPDLKVVG